MIPQLQTNARTFYGRYWTETTLLRRYFPSDEGLSILSFGCSTGEELRFLRNLFPRARLVGCDHDWASLASARALMGNEAIVFNSGLESLDAFGPFDIIVCNSVLLTPTVREPDGPRALPADAWIDAVVKLDAALNPGGVLQLINSNIPFRLHPAAENYTPVRTPLILGPNFVDQFDLEGRHLCTGTGGLGFSAMTNLHIAGPHWSLLQPTDLSDVHFQKSGGRILPLVVDHLLPNMRGGAVIASGKTNFDRTRPKGHATSSFVQTEIDWTALGAEAVRVNRTARRVWFDETVLAPETTVIEMEGAEATAFLEGMLGRPSTSLQIEAMTARRPTRAPSL